MNRTVKMVALTVVVSGLISLVCVLLLKPQAKMVVDGGQILAAMQAYTEAAKSKRVVVPQWVSLQELVDRGLLNQSSVKGFGGAEVLISSTADETTPLAVLALARWPDGREIVVMADGSVQQR